MTARRLSGRRSRRARAIALALAAVGAVTLASCTAISAVTKTQSALAKAGYTGARVEPAPTQTETILRVSYPTRAADVAAVQQEQRDVAKIVWRSAPMRFDAVDVSARNAPAGCVDGCTLRFDRATLFAAHGARDADLDRDARTALLGAGAAFIALVVAAVAMTIIMVMKSRRRAPRPWAYTPPGWAPQPGSPPQSGSPDGPRPAAPGPPSPWPPSGPSRPSGTFPPPAARVDSPAPATAWPPRTPPPAYEPPPPPLVVPTHDIWARPPS